MRVSTAKLDGLLRRAEELLAVKLSANQRAADLRSVVSMLATWEKEWAKTTRNVRALQQFVEASAHRDPGGERRRDARLASATAKLLEFLDWNHDYVKSAGERLTMLAKSADHDRRATGGIVDTLMDDSKKLLMLPFSRLTETFPRWVRDLARAQDKDVAIEIQGGDVEIDKRILEEMKDPLIHLLRNSVDHGIESPQERMGRGKPPRGTITMSVSQMDGSTVEIIVSDDGAGVDPAAVRAAAVRSGRLSEEEAAALSEQDVLGLLFTPDFTTRRSVTEISGRGLGLAIVKEKVEGLGGRFAVEGRLNQGSSFRLLLPLTLATFRGIVVEAADQTFVVPTAYVDRVVRYPRERIKTVEGRKTLRMARRIVPLERLADVLGLAARGGRDDAPSVQVIVLGTGDQRIGFQVDAVLEEQEVLVKPLGRPLVRVRNVAAATVLGSGKAVPIINVADLMSSASNMGGKTMPVEASAQAGEPKRTSILVVDDSITARTLLKNTLEAAGHQVTTAVDGVDAFSLLKMEPFDLVVSDVEMPRMNGFELTAKLRGDEKLGDLPVVLVTAMSSREDRERGMEAGANAYIIKSSFDHDVLLETIRRLV